MDLEILKALIIGILGCSAFWACVGSVTASIISKRSASNQMVMGIGHHLIVEGCTKCIERGYVTKDELDNLVNYLYPPYKKLGGNGTAEVLINKVKELPVK